MKPIPGTEDTYLVAAPTLGEFTAVLRSSISTYEIAEVRIRPRHAKRSTIQNERLWAMLADVSQQVNWYGKKLAPHEWKDVFSAALKRQEVVPGLEGGFVVLGQRTSRMSVREMSDMLTLMLAFGAEPEHRVFWTDPTHVDSGGG